MTGFTNLKSELDEQLLEIHQKFEQLSQTIKANAYSAENNPDGLLI